ncbi:unnamed protein product [Hydatigera taeniaeformis]|uniref:Secreted protein n=1 Tax=Hydatigena taeniaeformis TaxID=6205 RepID=A0A0R3WW50_HYDTA|nr:unnamed protein product [Hydatigera taeniaeformis]
MSTKAVTWRMTSRPPRLRPHHHLHNPPLLLLPKIPLLHLLVVLAQHLHSIAPPSFTNNSNKWHAGLVLVLFHREVSLNPPSLLRSHNTEVYHHSSIWCSARVCTDLLRPSNSNSLSSSIGIRRFSMEKVGRVAQ